MGGIEIAETENFIISAYGPNSKKWFLEYRLRHPEGRTWRRHIACICGANDKDRRSGAIETIDFLIAQLHSLKDGLKW